jgi:transposase
MTFPDERVDGLFEMDPVEPSGDSEPVGGLSGGKTFRRFDTEQVLLMPPSLDEWLDEEHLARFIADLVDECLDLSGIYSSYSERRGGPPYDPRLMLRILLFGYCTGVRSSRAIEKACHEMVPFRWLSANSAPDFRAVARFRKRHLSALAALFLQALKLCQAAGMVSLGQVALDGTKLFANASRRKAMSYARMTDQEKILTEEIDELMAEAERLDKAEDEQFGKDRRGDELPEELARRESRLVKITEAKDALEKEAADAAAAHSTEVALREGASEKEVALRATAASKAGVPKPKAQRNFTDPDSRIMPTAAGGFAQCYNAQAVVDSDYQVIVAADLNNCAADVNTFIPMTEMVPLNTGSDPGQFLTDAGYCSAANLEWADGHHQNTGTDFFIATGRSKHNEPSQLSPKGRIPNSATPKQRMSRKLKTKPGKATYARRKAIVEPVFGQMSTLQRGKQLLLRGQDSARSEWLLLATCHNLRKLHTNIGSNRVPGLATI